MILTTLILSEKIWYQQNINNNPTFSRVFRSAIDARSAKRNFVESEGGASVDAGALTKLN